MTYLPHNICYRIMFILGFVGWVMIYLDYAATTPCDAVVLQEMLPYFSEIFGNPNSLHQFGMEAKDALDIARNRIAEAINSDFEEVIFTSGATESTNIAITRTMKSLQKSGKNRFLTLPTEHKATLTVANYLKNNGFDTEFLDVNREGILEIATLENALDEQVGMLSICHINNETGTMQDIRNIINICHKHNVLVHVDATQSLGKTKIDVKDLDIDFLSASGHKVYAPKGIGVLFCKKANMKYLRVPRANPEVEFGIRAGTVPVCLCVGMGKAVEIANKDIEKNWRHATKLRQIFIDKIKSQLDEIYINGSEKVHALANNGTMGAKYEKGVTASESNYTITEQGRFTPPTTEGVTQYIIEYNRTVKDGTAILNKANQFPQTVRLVLKVLAIEPCTADTLRAGYLVLPSFQVSPEVSIGLTTD